jgi:hypothetical protein
MTSKIISSRWALTVAAGLAACSLQGSGTISASATLTETGTSGSGANTVYDYSLVLYNTGTVPINAFWYGWIQFLCDLPSSPSITRQPSGWVGPVLQEGSTYSVQFANYSGSAIPAGGFATFTFNCVSDPSAMTLGLTGGGPTGDSVVYSTAIAMDDADQSDPGIASNPFIPMLTTVAPTVSLTNPAPDAVFPAPASVNVGASAAVSSGAVTNVAFYGNTNFLGSAQAAPFNITTGSLPAGAYALTAVATAAGVCATSAVVNITVVTPVAVTNSAPQISSNTFSFNFSADAGLTYVVQNSSDLVNWLPLVTNVAVGSSVQATDTFLLSGQRFYRVVQQANP